MLSHFRSDMTIKEVSEKYNVPSATLRYYEKEGLIPHVPRSSGGIRCYGDSDIRWLELVICMRRAGLDLEAVREYRNLYEKGDETIKDRISLLKREREKLKERLSDTEKMLSRLDYKISKYEEALVTGHLEW